MTNSIRPFAVASLRVSGEAQVRTSPEVGGVPLCGAVTRGKLGEETRPNLRDGRGWLETEWPEDSMT